VKYEHVVAFVAGELWALMPEKLGQITAALALKAAGEDVDPAEVAAIAAAARRPGGAGGGTGVAVLPLHGVIAHRAGMVAESSGGTSVERFRAQLRQVADDPNVSAIVLDVDSPGGGVTGVGELADDVYRARGRKPVVAVANSLAASAAYWVASQADEVVVIPSGDVGSIGVFAAHQDLSRALEMRGIRTTLIAAGRRKAEGSPYGPLSEEALAHIREGVDHYYAEFTRAVARGRRVPVADVRGERFGEGAVLRAQNAVARGMADRVGTLEQVVQELAGGRWEKPLRAAVLDEAPGIAADADGPQAAEPTAPVRLADTAAYRLRRARIAAR